MNDLTDVVSAIITLIVALLTTFLIPYLRKKLKEEDFNTIKMWVEIAVKAAEMIFVGTNRGAEKKQYVMDFLKTKGFNLDEESVNNLIESAVQELNENLNA